MVRLGKQVAVFIQHFHDIHDLEVWGLKVLLIDDFKLQRGLEFIIAKVDGQLICQYDWLDELALVAQFERIYGNEIDLNITYAVGDGNDIGLYTDPQTLSGMNFW
ncbi:hypothetical protein [Synechococcus sp. UW179A]|uniref:hypothetical protein n=1 Tax=Synechococcus sp. UW179A TaxID=2575510 RepID=UPI000E0FF920|nr:hypothetical protein [Synechococcus sp. UW179A]